MTFLVVLLKHQRSSILLAREICPHSVLPAHLQQAESPRAMSTSPFLQITLRFFFSGKKETFLRSRRSPSPFASLFPFSESEKTEKDEEEQQDDLVFYWAFMGRIGSVQPCRPVASLGPYLFIPDCSLHSPQIYFPNKKTLVRRRHVAMRPLDEKETTAVFEKLLKFTGQNLAHIVNRPPIEGPSDAFRYVFRLHKNRVYYASDSLVRRATNVGRDRLHSVGTVIGKFTKSGHFRLTIHALDLLAAHARHKVWLKPTAEMTFLYGNSVLKGGLGRITENTNAGDGVVVFSMSDVPLGFGVAARGTQDCRKAAADAIVVNHQADLGEYLRNEDDL